MRRVPLLLALVVATSSGCLMAQDFPKPELFAGYQYLRFNNVFNSGANLNANGWNTSFTGSLNKHIGLTGDLSGAYKTYPGLSVPSTPSRADPGSPSGQEAR